MKLCRWTKRIEQYFDGESTRREEIQAHLQDCAHCNAYLGRLGAVREAVAMVEAGPGISDERFPYYFASIEASLKAPPRWSRQRLGAMISLAAAALVVALAVFAAFTGPQPADATVESLSTELEGATVKWYDSEVGAPTIEIDMSEDDIW